MTTSCGESIVLRNAIERPGYCPYCMRCRGLVRMQQVGHMHWRCRCGAEHDERACRELFEEFKPKPDYGALRKSLMARLSVSRAYLAR